MSTELHRSGPTERSSQLAVRFPGNSLATWMVVGLAMVVATVLLVQFVDRPLALYLRNQANPDFVAVFKTITTAGRAEPYIAVFLLTYLVNRYLFVRHAPSARATRHCQVADMALYVLTCMAVAGIAVNIAKYVIGRIRPRELFNSGVYGFDPLSFQTSTDSMPSGHSQLIWVVMTALSILAPAYRVVFLTVALLVSASRFITTTHFLSDVLIGSLVGVVVAILVKRWWFASVGTIDALMPGRRD